MGARANRAPREREWRGGSSRESARETERNREKRGDGGWAYAAKSREVLVSGPRARIVCARASDYQNIAVLVASGSDATAVSPPPPLPHSSFSSHVFFPRYFFYYFIFRDTALLFRHNSSPQCLACLSYIYTRRHVLSTHTSCRPISAAEERAAGDEALKERRHDARGKSLKNKRAGSRAAADLGGKSLREAGAAWARPPTVWVRCDVVKAVCLCVYGGGRV